MSDQNNAADTEDKPWIGKLANGRTYTFRGHKYEQGVETPMTEAVKTALEARAVDDRVVDGEYEEDGTAITDPRPKFQFRRVGEEAAKPRSRQRATR